METQIAGPGSDIGSAAALLRSGQEPAKPSDGSSTPSPTDVPAPTPQSSSEASASQEQPKLAFSAPLPDYDLDDKETQIAVQSTSLPPKPGKPESPTSSFEKTYAAFDLASQEMVEVVDRTQYAPGTGPAGPGEPRTTPEYGTPVTEPFGEAPSSSPETPAGSPQSKPDDSSSDAKSAFAPPVPPPPPGGVKPVAPPAPATGPTTEPSMERPVATPAPSGVTTTEPRTPPAATSQPGAAASSTAKGKTEFAQLPPKPAATGTPGARTGPRDTLFQEPNKPSALTADSPTSKGTTEVVNLSNPPPKVDKTMVAVTDDVRDFLAEAPPVRSEGEDEPATMKWSIDQSNPGMTVVPPSATGPAPPASPSPSSSMSAGPAAPGVPSPSSSLHGDDAGHTVKVTAMTEAEFQAALAEADRPKRRGLMIAAAVLVPLLLGGTAYGIWVASKDDATPTDDETSQSAGADGDDVNAGVAPDDEPPADEDEPPEPAPSTAAPNPDEPPDEPAAESGDTPKDTAEPEDSGSDDTAAPPEQPEPEPNATATPPDEPAIGDAREPQPKPSGGSKPTPVKKKKKKKNKPPPFPGFGPGSRTPP
jgi:hypothetical protein